MAAVVQRIRARMRRLILVNRALLLASVFLATAVALGVADYVVRLPEWIRWGHWIAGLGSAALVLWKYVLPAWRFAPSLTDIALRIERERPALRGLLASAIDFENDDPQPGAGVNRLSSGLAHAAVRNAELAWSGAASSGLIKPRTTLRALGAFAAANVLAVTLALLSPALFTIGATRLIAPWSGAMWPKLTGVADLTEGSVHARGTALPLQAVVTKSNRPWDSTYVAVRYRLINSDQTGPERRELLTWQQREVESPFAEPGALFERLIEPAADAVEFRFETEDDSTEWRRINLVPPPAVVSASAVITPPEYALRALAASDAEPPAQREARVELGAGNDDRAVAPPSLAGSQIDLTIVLNKPVEMPESVAEIFVDPEAPADAPGQGTITRRGATWNIRWTLNDSVRLPIHLRDEYGIESVDETVFRFESLADRPAAATIVDPSTDRTVLPTASVPVIAEGRDDVSLAWIALEHAVWTPAGEPGAKSPPGGALEQRGEAVVSARLEAPGRTMARTNIELDLKPLELKPGDEVRLAALAIDVRAAAEKSIEATRSAVRTLRVISEAQFVEEMQRSLADVRQAAIRAEEQQGELRERTEGGRVDASIRKGQGAISERLARQSEAVGRLLDRVRENRIEDRGLEELLSRARTSINDAGQASGRATQSLEQAAERRAGEPKQDEPKQDEPKQDEPKPTDPSPPGAAQPESSPTPASSGAQRPSQPQQSAGSSSGSRPAEPQQPTEPATPSSAEQNAQPGSQQSGEPGQSDAQQSSPAQQGQGQQAPPQGNQPATPQPEGEEQPRTTDPDLQQAAEAQQQVQDELRGLIELLDRGEDNWLARNTIERLAREQKELREATQETGRSTAGKTAEQLTPEQRTDLDRIVERQTALADQTAELARDLRDREKSLREKDPAAAQGMAQAARRAEQSQVAQTMRNAASEAQQNQTSRASRQQQQAEEALEEMLEDLDRVDKARDEVLRRELASVIESLEGLIKQQEAELTALDEATRAIRGLKGLDEGAIRLNQNTLGVLDKVKEIGPDAAPVATLVSRAADAQSAAITEIRRPIVGATMVREHENRSLSLLKQALAKAKELDDAAADRERKKKLADLKRRYREVLERQNAVRDESVPLAQAAELTRRDRQTARALSERQDVIGADLKEMLTQTSELQEAKVFDYAHVRMDAQSRASSAALTEGRIPDSIASQSALITTLKNVLEALNDPKPDDQKFAEGASGGQGGGGQSSQSPLLPPVKELMLLRQMQIDLAQQTIEASKAENVSPALIREIGTAQRELTDVGKEFVDRMGNSNSPGGPPPAMPEVPDAPKQ